MSPKYDARVHYPAGRDHWRGCCDCGRLIYPHVVHQHVLRWKWRIWIGSSEEGVGTADRQIQKNEKRIIENPFRARRKRCRRHLVIGGAIDEELYGILRPLDGVHVIVVGYSLSKRQRVCLGDPICRRNSRAHGRFRY